MQTEVRSRDEILKSHAQIPDNVVYRGFVAETVILNLTTGKYHGVNPTGGYILELLKTLSSVDQAARKLATEYGLSPEEAAEDVCDFCLELEQRGLIVLSGAA